MKNQLPIKVYGSMSELLEDINKNLLPTPWQWSEEGRANKVATPFGNVMLYLNSKMVLDVVPAKVGYYDGYTEYNVKLTDPLFKQHLIIYNAKGWIKETRVICRE